MTYKFEVPENGEYTVEVGFANPWWCALPVDVYLNGTLAGTCENTASPVTAKVASEDGYITVEAKTDADTINMAYIVISGAPAAEDNADETTAPQTGFATVAFAAAVFGSGAYIVSKKRH